MLFEQGIGTELKQMSPNLPQYLAFMALKMKIISPRALRVENWARETSESGHCDNKMAVEIFECRKSEYDAFYRSDLQ